MKVVPNQNRRASRHPEPEFISTNMIPASLEIECCNEMDVTIIGSSSKMNWGRSTVQTGAHIQLQYFKCSQLE